jgi:hypothetical protein
MSMVEPAALPDPDWASDEMPVPLVFSVLGVFMGYLGQGM